VTRRRRLWLAVGAVAVVVAAVVALVESSGSSGPSLGLGPRVDSTVLAPAGGRRPAAKPVRHSRAFVPAPAAARVASSLPLDRQVAQLFMVSLQGNDAPAVGTLSGIDWGGVVFTSQNFVTDGQMGALASDVAAAIGGAGPVPPFLAASQAGGSDNALPDLPPASESAIGTVDLARSQARQAGSKLKALGFNVTLAPLADVDIAGGGALTGHLFGSDPATVARLSLAAVDGYDAAGVISVPGHFPGAGAASADPDQMTATVGGSLAQLEGHDLIPFAAIAATAPVIMMSNASYAAFDGVTPAGLLPQAVRLLRRDYGFQGVVMSDDLDATLEATGSGPGAVAVEALQAGDDLLYISGAQSEHQAAYEAVLAAASRSGAVRRLVRQALLRVLTLKARYGILK
jgi:beta-N-acetylhexosaminidase